MRAALAEVADRRRSVPVVANVAVGAADRSATRSPRRLVEQVTGRVRWRETIEWFARATASPRFIEIGAGKVLTGLARRIDRELATAAVGTPAEVEAALAALA